MNEREPRPGTLGSLWRRVFGEPLGIGAGASRALTASQVGDTLRSGGLVSDATFDSLLPRELRAMSRVHWTPVRVAARCAELLVTHPGCRILDIGSGVGKFCTVAALTTHAHATTVVGVEQYPGLVDEARSLAASLRAASVSFVHGFFGTMDPADHDAFYLFNPFEENGWERPRHLHRDAPLVRGTFEGGVAEARRFLASARPGATVVTYNGLGGNVPPGYALVRREKIGCVIEQWRKEPRAFWAT